MSEQLLSSILFYKSPCILNIAVIDAAESILVFSGRALHLTSCEPGGGESLSLG